MSMVTFNPSLDAWFYKDERGQLWTCDRSNTEWRKYNGTPVEVISSPAPQPSAQPSRSLRTHLPFGSPQPSRSYLTSQPSQSIHSAPPSGSLYANQAPQLQNYGATASAPRPFDISQAYVQAYVHQDSSDFMPSAHRCNQRCIDTLLDFNRGINLGTSEVKWFLKNRSATIGISKVLTLTAGATQERTAATTMKSEVVNEWSEARSGRDYMSAMYGLMVSQCSLNGRRVSLWQLLTSPGAVQLLERGGKLSSETRPHYESLRDQQPLQALATLPAFVDACIRYLLQKLQYTGCHDPAEGTVLVCDPSTGLGLAIKPAWAGFVEDTPDSACFAMLTDECSVYRPKSDALLDKCPECSCRRPLSWSATVLSTQLVLGYGIPDPRFIVFGRPYKSEVVANMYLAMPGKE